MQIAIGPGIRQPVNQPRVSMKAKDDVLVACEERVVIRFAQAMRVLALRLQFHQIDNIDHPDFQVGQMLAKNGNGGQNFQRGRVAAAGHDDIRFGGVLVVAGPLPDANPFGAMHHGGVHVQPLREACLPATTTLT